MAGPFEYLIGKRVLVAGGGGFIAGHLVKAVRDLGAAHVRAVDVKPLPLWHQRHGGVEDLVLDLDDRDAACKAVQGADIAFNLAADMGGIGFIENNKARCMLSVLINTSMLRAARDADLERYFFSSSACVYPARLQNDANVTALKESDAYPADPEDGYGWEKLFSERMCRHFTEDFGLRTYVARYHNVYGPHGTWRGGREKAPAAICRKVAEAKRSGDHHIDIWGTGEQTRSFMYIDDCIDGTLRLVGSNLHEPLNIGSSELVSVNGLVDLVQDLAGIVVERSYDLSAPNGVQGRNSDNDLVRDLLGWTPTVSLVDGLRPTYTWIVEQLEQSAQVLTT